MADSLQLGGMAMQSPENVDVRGGIIQRIRRLHAFVGKVDRLDVGELALKVPLGQQFVSFPDYAWKPEFSFSTPGDLAIAYSVQLGRAVTLGDITLAWFALQTSAFTHTTAAGDASIAGLPAAARYVIGQVANGPLGWQGITKAGYTNIVTRIPPGGTAIKMLACGSGLASAFVGAADMPTGGAVILNGWVAYLS